MKYLEFYEKKQHGSLEFPIQFYPIDRNHSQYEMPPHWHKEFEIVRVLSGKFRLFLNNVEYILSQGDIALVSCGTLHRGEPQDCIYECIVFDLGMLRRHQKDIISPYVLPIMNETLTANGLIHPDNSMLYSSISALFTAMREQVNCYELSVYSLLFRIFALLYENGLLFKAERRRAGRQTDAILSLLDWIDVHYHESISLQQLSGHCGMNEKYLCRLFKEYTDRTPIDYVNHLRIENACHELAAGNKSITETAFDCGFNDLGYFSRTFKKYKGLTPKEYYKSAKENSILK